MVVSIQTRWFTVWWFISCCLFLKYVLFYFSDKLLVIETVWKKLTYELASRENILQLRLFTPGSHAIRCHGCSGSACTGWSFCRKNDYTSVTYMQIDWDVFHNRKLMIMQHAPFICQHNLTPGVSEWVSGTLWHIGTKRPFCVPDHKMCWYIYKYIKPWDSN